MKPSLQVRLSQHLALTPQLQQSIRLLQLSTLELHQEVEQMLEQNHKERMLALDKGIELPPIPVELLANESSDGKGDGRKTFLRPDPGHGRYP